jgi:cardiolipin synthase
LSDSVPPLVDHVVGDGFVDGLRASVCERSPRSAGRIAQHRAGGRAAAPSLPRAAGGKPIPGNRLRLLRDATENYPAWLDAIRSATRTIYFECCIIRDDEAGSMFADALSARARDGVRVRLLYDWLGAAGHTPWRFWRRLRQAGIDVRCFNPPRLSSPLE